MSWLLRLQSRHSDAQVEGFAFGSGIYTFRYPSGFPGYVEGNGPVNREVMIFGAGAAALYHAALRRRLSIVGSQFWASLLPGIRYLLDH